MQVARGDRIVVSGHGGGEPDRDCEVLAVIGKDGAPPYRVRWGDNGHEGLYFPGTDARVHHFEHEKRGP